MSGHSPKVCILCGQDCSSQPRTKDDKGRYYHRSCHAEALSRRRDGGIESVWTEPTPSPTSPADGGGMMEELLALEASAPAPPVAARMCPSCGSAVPGDAVICINCGMNLQTGTKSLTKASTAYVPPKPRMKQGTGTGWQVFDIIARCVIAIVALVFVGLAIAGFMATGEMKMMMFGALFVSLFSYFFLWLALLTVAAFRVNLTQGLLTLLVPLYFIVFLLAFNRDRTLRYGSLVWFLGLGLLIGLFLHSLKDDQFENNPGFDVPRVSESPTGDVQPTPGW